MDRDIRKQNMIPGSCEEFTRPEEIQALNRYLKDLREAYDDNLTINEDNLEVTGRKFLETPQNLPDKIEVLNPGKGEVSSLVSSKEWLDNDKSLSGLSTKKEGLNGNNDVASLRQTRQDLKGKNESGSLENSKEILKGKKDIKTLESQKSKIGGDTDGPSRLETNRRETIEGLNRLLSLDSNKEGLRRDENSEPKALDYIKEILNNPNSLNDLGGLKKKLEDDRKELKDLDNSKETLRNGKNDSLELGKKKETIQAESTRKLGDTVEKLKTNGNLEELGKSKETINAKEVESLLDSKEKLRNGKEELLELGRPKEEIGAKENLKELGKTKESLNTGDLIEKLKTPREKLEGISNIDELGSFIDSINPDEVDKLGRPLEQLGRKKEDLDLGNTKERLNGVTSLNNLPEPKEDLKTGDEIESLKRPKESLEGVEENIRLEDSKERLGRRIEDPEYLNKRTVDLEGTNSNIKLEDEKERLIDRRADQELGRGKEELPGFALDKNLSEHQEKLGVGVREETLEDYVEKANVPDKSPTLEDGKEKLKTGNPLDALGKKKEELVGEINDPILSEKRENLTISNEDPSLSTKREDITDLRKAELNEHRENLNGIEPLEILKEHKEELNTGKPMEELPEHMEHIYGKYEEPEELRHLLDKRDDLHGVKDIEELGTGKERISGEVVEQELGTEKETLVDKREQLELAEENENLLPGEIIERQDLPEFKDFLNLPNVDPILSEKQEKLDVGDGIGALENKVEGLNPDDLVDELSRRTEELGKTPIEPTLSETVEHLRTETSSIEDLEHKVELLDAAGSTVVTKLPEEKETIIDDKAENLILSDKREDLFVEGGEIKAPDLEDYVEGLGGTPDDKLNLEDHREDIIDLRTTELESKKEILEDLREDPELGKTTESMETDHGASIISELPDKEQLERLVDEREIVALSDHKETIDTSATKVDALEDTREEIIGEPLEYEALVDYKETITDSRDTDLENTRLDLSDERDTTLEDTKVTISDQREPELEDYRDNLEDSREPTLEDYRESLSDNRDTSLEDTKITIEDSRENSLVDYKETITDSRDTDLENTRLDLSDERDLGLYDETTSRNLDGNTIPDSTDEELYDESTKIAPKGEDPEEFLHTEDTSKNLEGNTINDTLDEELYTEGNSRDLNTIDDTLDKELYTSETSKELDGNMIPDTLDEELYTEETSRELEGNTIPDTLDEELYTSETSKELEGNMIPDTLDETLEDYIDSLDDYRDDPELHTEDTSRELEMNKIPDTLDEELYTEETSRELSGNTIDDTLDEVLYTRDETVGTKNLGYQLDTNSDSGNNAISAYNVGDGGGDSDLTDLSTRQDNVTWKDNTVERVGDDTSKQNADAFGSRTGEWSEDVGLYDTILSPENIDPDSYNQGGDKELHTSANSKELEMNMIPDTLDEELYDESTKIQPDGEDPEEFLHTEDSSVGISIDGIDINKIDDTLDEELYNDSTKISPDGEDPEEELYTKDTSRELEGNKISDTLDEELYDDSTKINPTEFGEDPDEELYDEGTSRDLNTIDDTLDEDLEDFVDTIEDDRDTKLYGSETKITPDEPTKENADTDKQHERWTEDAGLYDSTLQVTPDKAEEVWQTALETHKETIASKNEIKDVGPGQWKEDIIKNEHEETESLEDQVENVLNSTNSKSEIDELKNILNSRDDLNLYYTNILKFAQNKNLNKGWASKVTGLMSAYLSGGEVSQGRAQQFEEALYKTIIQDEQVKIKRDSFLEDGKGDRYNKNEISALDDHTEEMKSYELPGFNLMGNGCDPSSYLRWVAENTVGKTHGKLRAILLDETLGLLVLARDTAEKLIHANRDRLPGNDILSQLTGNGLSLGGVAKAAVSAGAKALFGGSGPDMTLPNNRPFTDGERGGWTELLSDKRIDPTEQKQTKFMLNDKYISSFAGVTTTLSDLCGVSNSSIQSVEQLYAALRASPYITTAEKVTSGQYNPLKVQTLDTNQFWEIIFTPFVGKENGNRSYLPPITEINTWNKVYHGVKTGYSTWIPVTGFELSKAKLTSKTLPLFDGEISYPISMEFTNEFRLTIADDQFKSWRTYFERCMDAAIYNSEIHIGTGDYKDDYNTIEFNGIDDYNEEENGMFGAIKSAISAASKVTSATSSIMGGGEKFTAIDKKYQCVAPYKNITFRCTIYSMTPQFSTVSKYDLLLVMKDFVEERSGEIDGEPGDLTVMFSIVGENPSEDRKKAKKSSTDWKTKRTKDTKRSNLASIVSSGVNSVIGVL